MAMANAMLRDYTRHCISAVRFCSYTVHRT